MRPGRLPHDAGPVEPLPVALDTGETPPPLTDPEGHVLHIIAEQPEGRGITGPEIIREVRRRLGYDIGQSTLTTPCQEGEAGDAGVHRRCSPTPPGGLAAARSQESFPSSWKR